LASTGKLALNGLENLDTEELFLNAQNAICRKRKIKIQRQITVDGVKRDAGIAWKFARMESE
jgi:hypothetical protein